MKKSIKIISIALVAIIVVLATIFIIDSTKVANPKDYDKFLLSAFHGSYDKEGSPKTYLNIEQKKDDENNEIYEYVKLKFSSSTTSSKIKEIWVNVSDMKTDLKTKAAYTSSSTYFEDISKMTNIETQDILKKDLKQDKDGWIKIFEKPDDTTYYSYFIVGFYGEARVRELVFVDSDNKYIEYTYKATSLGKYPLENLGGEKVCDEQDLSIWEKE